MDEEHFQNFHDMGRFTFRQTNSNKDEGKFVDECTDCDKEPLDKNDLD